MTGLFYYPGPRGDCEYARSPAPGGRGLPFGLAVGVALPDDEFDAAVFFAAGGGGVVGDGLQAADADGVEALLVDVAGEDAVLYGDGALGREAHVVVGIAGVVGVALDAQGEIGVALEHGDDAVDQRLG